MQEVVAGPAAGGQSPSDYFGTSGSQIADGQGRPVRVAAVGCLAGDSDLFAPFGLNAVNDKNTISDIKTLGVQYDQTALVRHVGWRACLGSADEDAEICRDRCAAQSRTPGPDSSAGPR